MKNNNLALMAFLLTFSVMPVLAMEVSEEKDQSTRSRKVPPEEAGQSIEQRREKEKPPLLPLENLKLPNLEPPPSKITSPGSRSISSSPKSPSDSKSTTRGRTKSSPKTLPWVKQRGSASPNKLDRRSLGFETPQQTDLSLRGRGGKHIITSTTERSPSPGRKRSESSGSPVSPASPGRIGRVLVETIGEPLPQRRAESSDSPRDPSPQRSRFVQREKANPRVRGAPSPGENNQKKRTRRFVLTDEQMKIIAPIQKEIHDKVLGAPIESSPSSPKD